MKQEIREKIEKIRKGEVPEGYRRTKVGIIPVEWGVDKLGNHAFITKLAGFEYSDYFNSYKDGGEIIVIRGTNIKNKIIEQTSIGAQPSLSMMKIRSFRIIIPKLIEEQQKIADILSTWNNAIELKEKLIEEKKEFKRGLMNNIISAKMKDDSGWKFAKFKEIFKIIKRPIDKHPEEEYKRLIVKRRLGGVELRDIKKGKEILVDSQHIVKKGDFIISNRQVFHGELGLVQKKHENSIISNEYSILRCNEGFDTEFLFYCMHSPQLKKTIIKRTQGVQEEKFLFLFNEWYKTLGLHIPSIDEQKSIVSVLNNLTENIRILTSEVALLKEQKKGLMQLLLTGIIRVEVN